MVFKMAPNEAVPPRATQDKAPAPQMWRNHGKELMRGLRGAKRPLKDLPYVARQRQNAKRRMMLGDQQVPALPAPPAATEGGPQAPLALPPPEAPDRPLLPIPARIPSQAAAPPSTFEPPAAPAGLIPPQGLPPVPETLVPLRSVYREDRLDDVPISIRKRTIPQQLVPIGEPDRKRLRIAFVFTLTTLATDQVGPQNECLSRHELALLENLTSLDITASRWHPAPRKRMQVPTKQRNRARTSILIGEDPAITYIVQENAAEVKQKPKKKAPFLWTGLSVFHQPETRHRHTVY